MQLADLAFLRQILGDRAKNRYAFLENVLFCSECIRSINQ